MLLLRLNPDGCLGIECGGRIVATATLVCYQDQLAWLGMVLTHPEFRNRGFARSLVGRALELSQTAMKVQTVKLDATDQGRPIYEKLGFRSEQIIERWSGPHLRSSEALPAAATGTPDLELDKQAFAANRAPLLESLAAANSPAFVNKDAYAMWRPGARASYLGPCVARSSDSAKSVIKSCLQVRRGPWYWDLFPSNPHAVKIAGELNFKTERRLVRMTKGADLRGCESMVYAGGGFELG